MSKLKWPFGASDIKNITGTGAETIIIDNNKTVLKISGLTGIKTLNLDIDPELQAGAELIIEVTQGATGRNVVLGTGFQTNSPDLTGDANDVDSIVCEYDGAAFFTKSQTKVLAVV